MWRPAPWLNRKTALKFAARTSLQSVSEKILRGRAPDHAGVVYENIDGAKRFDRFFDQPIARFGFAQIRDQRRLLHADLADGFERRQRFFGRTVHGDIRARFGQRDGHPLAESSGRSRHQRIFAPQIKHVENRHASSFVALYLAAILRDQIKSEIFSASISV
jgi:hypothetical protein